MVKMINDLNEYNEIVKNGVTLIDFFATWCGPCRLLAPLVENLEEKYHDKIKVYKVDVDQNIELANMFKIRSIPFLALIKNGEVIKTDVGFKPLDELEDWIKDVL